MAFEHDVALDKLAEFVVRDPESWKGVFCLFVQRPEDMPDKAFKAQTGKQWHENPGAVVAYGKQGAALLGRHYAGENLVGMTGHSTLVPDVSQGWQKLCGLLGMPPEERAAQEQEVSGGELSLLIVEDDRMGSQIMANRLQQYGNVEVTGNYRTAIANSMVKRPDIVFLDIHYRDDHNDGFDVMHNLASFDPRMFVVMFSADNDPLTIYRCMAAGAQGFIAKPFEAVSFAYYVNKFHRLRQAEA